ncbi:unnamed protein product [Lymnaea stagnalis]|uniref:C-type lectin domain-containing protein n=1 Tax=Lymnaea stagnalis TaxID=6523 RepID=A0AAV2H4E0_LYMST
MRTLSAFLLGTVLVSIATSQTLDNCPAGLPRDRFLQVHGDFCFQFVLNRLRTHTLAKADCESHGGTLALVKTPDIQAYLYKELVITYNLHLSKIWIGLNDIDNENIYKWEDGTPLNFTAWDSGEGPNSGSFYHATHHNENDCVVIDLEYDSKWAEFPCDESSSFLFFTDREEHYYICQYKFSASVATSTTQSSQTTAAPETAPPAATTAAA